jgi:hypothetical protein
MIRRLGLGRIASAAAGITISTTTNASPVVATFNAGHGLKNGDRVAVTGITGNTGANGEWTLNWLTATTAQLLGSVGNGVHGGTPVVSVICDVTPFMKGHEAVGMIVNTTGVAILAGTIIIEGSPDNVTFADARVAGSEAVPAGVAATSGIGYMGEFTLQKYMRMRCSAFTSGGADAFLLS